MLIIENEQIRVEVIDPNNHQGLIGSRYCTGGQIFQVVDKLKGNLLSGPTFRRATTLLMLRGFQMLLMHIRTWGALLWETWFLLLVSG